MGVFPRLSSFTNYVMIDPNRARQETDGYDTNRADFGTPLNRSEMNFLIDPDAHIAQGIHRPR